MSRFVRFFPLAVCCGLLALVGGCSTAPKAPPAYTLEEFVPQSPFQRQLEVAPDIACRLGRRALLSQGYQIEAATAENVRGSKYFHPKRNQQMQLEITLVCMPEAKGSVVFASAIQTRYEVKAGSQSSGVSVAGIGSISLPIPEGSEALIKVGQETVTDPDFYARLFALLETLAE